MVKRVAHLNADRFMMVSDTVASGPVIITDERIEHIRLRHQGDWESYGRYIREVIENPDFILRDNNPATAVCLLRIEIGGVDKYLRVTLRLHTLCDAPNRQHSVLTFQKINRKEYGRLTRSQKSFTEGNKSVIINIG